MADETDPRFQFLLQETGGNDNSWGENLNDNWEKASTAIGGFLQIAVTGGTLSLSDDQQRYPIIEFTGTLTADQVVEVNDAQGNWIIINDTSGDFALEFKTDSGNLSGNIEVGQGATRQLCSDATDVFDTGLVTDIDFTSTTATFNNGGSGSFTTLVDAAAGQSAKFGASTAGSLRWDWGRDDTAEAGSDAGSDFELNAYDDSGELLYTVMFVPRDTGEVSFQQGINLGNTAGTIRYDSGDIEFEYSSGSFVSLNDLRDNVGLEGSIQLLVDGGGAIIQAGEVGSIRVPYDCTITGVTMMADQSGSAVVDIWADTLANYPPTNADSITASAPPTLSSETNSEDTTLTGWTTALTAGDVLLFNVDSAATITKLTIALEVVRT